MRIAPTRDTVSRFVTGSGAIKPMPEVEIAKAVQLLDLMLEFFADDGHWTRGRYDDGNLSTGTAMAMSSGRYS